MTFEEICDVALTLEQAILSNNPSNSEAVAIVALLEARLQKRRFSKAAEPVQAVPARSPLPAVEATPERKAEPIKVKSKSIEYDPLYDPPPPMTSDPLPPPQDATPGKLLARANTACICNACNSVAYTTNKEIRDGCKVQEFIDSFTPVGATPKISKSIEIQNIDGNISTDCPLCGAHKTLYLIGKKAVA